MFKFFKNRDKIRKLEIENVGLKGEIEYLKKRLRRAGSLPYYYHESEKVATVEAEAHTYGNYAVMDDNVADDMIEMAKGKIMNKIIKGLIDLNLVQFIVKTVDDYNAPPFQQKCTVGAKLRVIPWEQMVRSIRLFPEEEKNDGKNKDENHNGSKVGSGYTCAFTGQIETGETEEKAEYSE